MTHPTDEQRVRETTAEAQRHWPNDDEYFAARTKQAATEVYQFTGDEWNATTRLRTIEDGGKLTADQARFARQCVEDLGRAEWLVRKDRDALRSHVCALEEENARQKDRESAWADYAFHLEHCVTCSQTSWRDCWEGEQLRAAVVPSEERPNG